MHRMSVRHINVSRQSMAMHPVAYLIRRRYVELVDAMDRVRRSERDGGHIRLYFKMVDIVYNGCIKYR